MPGFPGDSDSKESTCNVGDHGLIPVSRPGKIPWRREWGPTPVFSPGDPMDRGIPLQATVSRVAKSQARLSN